MLAYRLPRQPSNPRVAIWRALRRMGAVQLVDGLVALPADARTREQLDWLADQVLEAGGDASVWVARAGSAGQERALAARMAGAVADSYRAVAADAERATTEPPASARRALARLRRELRRIGQRDYFPPKERDAAREAVRRLAERLTTEEVGSR